jgi:predicted transcriptional regulator
MFMKPECKDITRIVLPAVRASVAEVMHDKYGYKQEEIARKLGVVQVAVSKYLNGKYSKEISGVKDYIIRRRLNDGVVRSIVAGSARPEIERKIDDLCAKLCSSSQVTFR